MGVGSWIVDLQGAMAFALGKFLTREGSRVTFFGWFYQDLIEGLQAQITNADRSRTFVATHMHNDRLYVIEGTVPAGAPQPGLFQQSMQFLDGDGRRSATRPCTRTGTRGRGARADPRLQPRDNEENQCLSCLPRRSGRRLRSATPRRSTCSWATTSWRRLHVPRCGLDSVHPANGIAIVPLLRSITSSSSSSLPIGPGSRLVHDDASRCEHEGGNLAVRLRHGLIKCAYARRSPSQNGRLTSQTPT